MLKTLTTRVMKQPTFSIVAQYIPHGFQQPGTGAA
jgi:hypothetical protein